MIVDDEGITIGIDVLTEMNSETFDLSLENDSTSKVQPELEIYNIYLVQPNDTVESVAAKFNMTPSNLCFVNKLSMRTIFVNQKLKVRSQPDEDKKCFEDHQNFNCQVSPSGSFCELLCLQYVSKYMKLSVRYITDLEGVVTGTLILTPLSLIFLPAFKDPAVIEYGEEKYSIHLPNDKIACISMYNDSSIIGYKRSQRTDMQNKIVSPIHKPRLSMIEENLLSAEKCIQEEVEEVIQTVFGLPNDEEYEVVEEVDEILDQPVSRKSTVQNYLCIVASPRYRKVQVCYQVEDEYWFMVPAESAQDILQYLLINGKTKYDIGADVEFQTSVRRDASAESTSKRPVLTRRQSFSQIRCKGSLEKKNSIDSSVNDFVDWEIVNQDHNMHPEDDIFLSESGILKSEILDIQKTKELLRNMPADTFGAKWEMIYSTSKNGWSLRTLYRNVFDFTRNPCILIIKDFNSNVFGALCSHHIKLSNHFYGNGTTFLFRWHPNFQKFTFAHKNEYFLFGQINFFAIGCSNSRYALRLNDTLFNGITQSCETFNSPPLVDKEFFDVLVLEVWSFY